VSALLDDMVDALTVERHAILVRAVELGKWPDGRVMDRGECETSLQILIAYDYRHKNPEDRIGFVPPVDDSDCDHEASEYLSLSSSLIIKG
jgi:uncharacterized protein YeaC (DUF1315 family)